MKLRSSSYLLIGILAFTLFLGAFSLTYPSIKTKLLPAIVSGLVFILAAIELRKEILAGRQAEGETGPEAKKAEAGARSERRRYVLAFGWMAGLLCVILLVGFLAGIPLFLFSFLKSHGHGWLMSVALAAVMLMFVYFVFAFALEVDLFEGLIFGGHF